MHTRLFKLVSLLATSALIAIALGFSTPASAATAVSVTIKWNGTAVGANAVVIGSPTAPNGTPIAGLGQVQDTSTAQASGISATNETTNRKPKDDRPNRLPNTGGPMIALLWLGAGLTLTGGVVLTGATRRRKKSV